MPDNEPGAGRQWRAFHVDHGHRHVSGLPAGVVAGPLVFLSAVRGLDPETNEPLKDPEEQAFQLFENVRAALAPAGAGLDDVVKMAVYMRDLHTHRILFNKAWKSSFGTESPARFAVEVADFGGEGDDSFFLADVTAYVGDRSS